MSGILKKGVVRNPKGPDAEYYFVGDCIILWPAGGEVLYTVDVGAYIEVSGVMIRPVPNSKMPWLAKLSLIGKWNKIDSALVVLNYKNRIDISALLHNYGLGYFKQRGWRETKINCVFFLPTIAVTLWFLYTGFDVPWAVPVFVGTAVVSVVASTMMDLELDKKAEYSSDSHIKRLAGKIFPAMDE